MRINKPYTRKPNGTTHQYRRQFSHDCNKEAASTTKNGKTLHLAVVKSNEDYSFHKSRRQVLASNFQLLTATKDDKLNNDLTERIVLPSFLKKDEVLKKIDEKIWRAGRLFEKINDQNSDSYIRYLTHLKNFVENYSDYFSVFGTHDTGDNSTNFVREFNCIFRSKALTRMEKSVYLTQALELALMGINITPVLQNLYKQFGATGFRQELIGSWFLAKFVYANKIDHLYRNQIIPDVYVEGKNGKSNRRYSREVDSLVQINPNALVSVKHNGKNNLAEQIKKLVYSAVNNDYLIGSIDRLIAISGSDDKDKWLSGYKERDTYAAEKQSATEEAKKIIKKENIITSFQEQYIYTLLVPEKFDIYYIPFAERGEDLQKWIQMIYSDEKGNEVTA